MLASMFIAISYMPEYRKATPKTGWELLFMASPIEFLA
jgi:hypothetical protein